MSVYDPQIVKDHKHSRLGTQSQLEITGIDRPIVNVKVVAIRHARSKLTAKRLATGGITSLHEHLPHPSKCCLMK